jgi:hypothetical protein
LRLAKSRTQPRSLLRCTFPYRCDCAGACWEVREGRRERLQPSVCDAADKQRLRFDLEDGGRAAGAPMPATAAAFQINTAKAAESSEEDFSAVIRLAENLARVNTHQNGRDNLQSSKLEIRDKFK